MQCIYHLYLTHWYEKSPLLALNQKIFDLIRHLTDRKILDLNTQKTDKLQ